MRSRSVLLLAVLLLVLSAVVLFAGACGGQTTTTVTGATTSTSAAALGAGAHTYTDSKYGYKFLYPNTWKIDTGTTTDATAGSTATRSIGAFDPNGSVQNGTYIDLMVVSTFELHITVTDADIPSLESEIQKVLASLETQAPDLQIVSSLAQTEAAGLKGYTVTYTFTKQGTPTTSTLFFLFKGNIEYQVSTQAATVDWQKDQPTFFAAMLASFTAP